MVELPDEVVTRRVLQVALDYLVDDPVVLLEGPRSVGKSTLLRQIADAVGGRILDLDDPAIRDAVAVDPSTFVAGGQPVCIDEYQKAPIVLEALKAELNRDSRAGRFVLTGSTRHEALPNTAQALTGRLSRLSVSPFSQGELAGCRETLLADLLAEQPDLVARIPTSATSREQYIRRIVVGGFPMALTKSSDDARNRWIDEYLRLTLGRDVRELSQVRQGHLMAPLFRQLASRTAQVLNVERVRGEVGLDRPTTYRYLDLLEAVFLIYRLPGWGKNLRARTTSAPKVHLVDSGVAARVLRLTPAKLASLDATSLSELGHLVETFAVGELCKQASWLPDVGPLGHWRTSDGDEVDLVIERDDGAVVAFEVKTAGRVPGDEFRGLRKLQSALGARFLAGVVLYLGARSYTFDDRLHVMSLDRIWTQPTGSQG